MNQPLINAPTHAKATRFRIGIAGIVAAVVGGAICCGLSPAPAYASTMTVVATQANNTEDGSSAGTVQNNGGGSNMLVKNSAYLPTDRKAFLLFDLAGDNPDPTAAATLTITQQLSGNASDTYGLYALNSGYTTSTDPEQGGQPRLGTAWTAAAIDGDNAPGNNSGSTGFESNVTEIATFTVGAANNTITINIPSLAPYLQSDGTLTLMLHQDVNNGDNGTAFYTNLESNPAYQPTLTFSTSPVPEPAAIGLLGVGGLAVLLARRQAAAKS